MTGTVRMRMICEAMPCDGLRKYGGCEAKVWEGNNPAKLIGNCTPLLCCPAYTEVCADSLGRSAVPIGRIHYLMTLSSSSPLSKYTVKMFWWG